MQVWEVISEKCLHHYEGHTDWVLDVAWSPDGNLLVSADSDQTVCVWDVATGHTLLIYRGYRTLVVDVTWSPDGVLLVSASSEVHVWQVQ
jgi:WD40 repeat protein